jgi:hypothetical protein
MADESAREVPPPTATNAATSPRRPRTPPPPLFDATLRRLLSTHNPLYAISAALVFYGLRISFRTEESHHAAYLLASLSAYVVLLATTAVLLRRVGALWEDLRMLALLVLLLLLGISVTFDRTLLADRTVGTVCFLAGWLLSVGMCELLFYGLRVRLRIGYRLPFHALLATFFFYPLLVAEHASQLDDRTLSCILFFYPVVTSLLLLTTLPAALRGPEYVADNGTPWGWPLYPATLFFVLVLGLMGRSYYLCYSFHAAPDGQSIFGAYFLMPLVFACGLIVLVAGRRTGTRIAALLAPPIAVALTLYHPAFDPTHREFLQRLIVKFTAGPTSFALLLGAAFYLFAMARRVPCATACLFVFCYMTTVRADATDAWAWQSMHWPYTAATIVAAIAALRRRSGSWAWSTVVSAGIAVYIGMRQSHLVPAGFATWHAIAIVALAMSYLVDTGQRGLLRTAPALLVTAMFTEALTGRGLGVFHDWEVGMRYYPPAALVAGLALAGAMRERPMWYFLGFLAAEWLGLVGWCEYLQLRKLFPGLDAIALGLLAFAAAVLVSLAKTERFTLLRLTRPPPGGGPTNESPTEA